MKHRVSFVLVIILILLSSRASTQVPDLGSAASFVLFTDAGAVGSTGISDITGNVGSNAGAITGFGSIDGDIYNADATTAQVAIDVMAAYNQLFNTPATSTTHTPAFGNGETLFAGVYSIAGASSVLADLTLDAQGDPNAVFIFKAGGALTTAASTTVHLTNGALSSNIFWIADGAISMAASTTIAGTFIANNGAVDMGNGSTLEGRLLSTAGAVSVYGTHAFVPYSAQLSLGLLSFSGICSGPYLQLKWVTAIAKDNIFFVEESGDGVNWRVIGKVDRSAGKSVNYTYAVERRERDVGDVYYRLLQNDLAGKKSYGNIILVRPCGLSKIEKLLVYPNPSTGIFKLQFTGEVDDISSISIYTNAGLKVYQHHGFPSLIDISRYAEGGYIISVQLPSSVINQKIIVTKP